VSDESNANAGSGLAVMDFNARSESGGRTPRALTREAGPAAPVDDAARARRLLAILRFLTDLRDADADDELIRTVLQAAAVWYDLEASAYRRDGDGNFVLYAWLPGIDVSGRPRTLPASVVLPLRDAPAMIASVDGLEAVGDRDVAGDIVLVPIIYGGRHQSIIAAHGVLDDETMATLAAVAQAVGAVMQQRLEQEVALLRAEVRRVIARPNLPQTEIAASVLRVMMDYLSAPGGDLLVESTEGFVTLAASPAPPFDRADDGADSVDRLTLAQPLQDERAMRMHLTGAPSVPFRPLAIAAVEAALDEVQRWLDSATGQALVAGRETLTAGFERRIDEEVARARRFGLELVVLLIGSTSGIPTHAEGAIADAVRGGLRGSDLVGRLGLGEIAVILVHTGVHGARSVEERLKERLQTVLRDGNLPSITIGEGGFPSAGDTTEALLSRARAQHTVVLNDFGTGDGH
jgi:hypothetical protein